MNSLGTDAEYGLVSRLCWLVLALQSLLSGAQPSPQPRVVETRVTSQDRVLGTDVAGTTSRSEVEEGSGQQSQTCILRSTRIGS